VFKRNWYKQLQSFWVYPSMFYSDGQWLMPGPQEM
jgi:Mlc titration factor MtfA (ptsG expression regulator)